MKKVLKKFNMADAKPVNVLLGGHFKLSEAHTPTTKDEKALISEVSYTSAVGNLIVCYHLHETEHCSSSESC